MASSVHPFQPTQACSANAPPPNYGNPGAYGSSPGGAAPPGYGYGYAPNGAAYGSAPPGYAYGAPSAASYPPNGAAQGYPPPGGYAYAPPPGSAGYPNGAPPPDGVQPYAYGAPPDGVQPYAYGAPGAVGSPPNGGAQGYPPVNGGAPGYAYGAPNGAPGYPLVGGMPVYPVGGAPQHPVAGTPGNEGSYAYGSSSAMYNSGMPQATGYPPGDVKVAVDGEYLPRAQPIPRDEIQTGRWAAGLCSCCDHCVPNCVMPCCCPFVSLAQVYARMGLQPYLMALVQFLILYIIGLLGYVVPTKTTYVYNYTTYSYESTSTSLGSTIAPVLIMLTRVVFCIFAWRGRAAVRARFEIPGDCCTDCLASFCCSCCAIAQMATHVKSYTPGSCTFDGPDVLPPYTR